MACAVQRDPGFAVCRGIMTYKTGGVPVIHSGIPVQAAGSRHFNCDWLSKQTAKYGTPCILEIFAPIGRTRHASARRFFSPAKLYQKFISNPLFTEIIVREVSMCSAS